MNFGTHKWESLTKTKYLSVTLKYDEKIGTRNPKPIVKLVGTLELNIKNFNQD